MKNMKWLCSIVLALTLVLGTTVCTVPAADLEDDLLVYYTFDGANMYENSGTLGAEYDAYPTAGDYYRPDGAVSNGTIDSDTDLGKAADLNAASNTWIQFPNRLLTKAEGDFTISFWYNDTEETVAAEKRVVDFIGNGIAFWLDFQVNNGVMCLNISDDAQAIHNINTGISSSGWHMYTLTVERGETTDLLSFYVDGVLVNSDNTFKVFDYYERNQADDNLMDNYNGFGGSSFGSPLADGAIDEFRFYKAALTADEVNALVPKQQEPEEPEPDQQGPAEQEAISTENLLVYYNFDGNDMYANNGSLGADYNAYPTVGDFYRPDGAVSNGIVDSYTDLGKAADLNAASNTWIQFPNRLLTKAEEDITISFWYDGNDAVEANEKRVVSFIGNGIAFWLDFQVFNGSMRVMISDNNDDPRGTHYLQQNTISSNDWHMYTLTLERGEDTDLLSFYVDGVLVDSDNSFKVFDYHARNQADDNLMDNYNGFGGSSFATPLADGAIDEFRFYDTAFSAGQVATLYADPFSADENAGNTQQPPVTGDISMVLAVLAAGAAALGGMKLRRK